MTRRVLIAPDAFKGTLTAAEVAAAIAAGVVDSAAEADLCPVADGGEGTAEVLIAALGGEWRRTRCADPLGREIEAGWASLGDGSMAIVEAMQASGLALLTPVEYDAERASTAGVGRLMRAAAASGARRLLVTVGGTATTDGGAGAIEAVEADGGLEGVEMTVLCDVTVPYESAARVFAPQKGASPAAVERLTERLATLARELPRDPTGVPMSGAGGGLSGGLWARFDARLVSGADYVLDAVGFDRRLEPVDAVVIGEGRLDGQSLAGKIGGRILARARARGVDVHAIVGSVDPAGIESVREELASVRIAGTVEDLVAAGRNLASALA